MPAGPPVPVRVFGPTDRPISQDGVTVEAGGWRIDSRERRTVRLFEVASPGVESCMLTYRAQLKFRESQGPVYLEMWCRVPGLGEFFSKDFDHAMKGSADWGSYEVWFYLKKGQRPDLVKLNLVTEGAGTVWVREIELLKTPLV